MWTLLQIIVAATVRDSQALPTGLPTIVEENRDNQKICLIEGDIRCDLPRNYFKVAPLDTYRGWTNRVVPYTLDSSYNEAERNIISEAIEEIQRKSCIKFKPAEGESDYLFVERGSGCFSFVGRTGGTQSLTLSSRCFLSGAGTVIHEFLHALGFWHEQNRYDRDDHVKINTYNIIPGLEMNFRKVPRDISDLQGLEYDYESILHYGRKAFAVDVSEDTIIPLDPEYFDIIGQRRGLSELDVKRLNMYYRCDIEQCEEPPELIDGFRVGDDFGVGQTVTFDCEEGYTLVGSKEVFCRFDGIWSGFQPTCKRLYTGHACNFTNDLCGWAQDDSDDFDWTRTNGATPSDNTGPMVDHTSELSTGSYIYIEASEPREEGEKARIITPTLGVTHLDDKQVCVTVHYHMWGRTVGTLNIYVRYYNRKDVLIWSKSGDPVPEWRKAKLSFNTDTPVQLVFEGVIGSGSKGDIALDDIVLEGCEDNLDYDVIDVSKPDPPDRWKGPEQSVFQCEFEDSICGTSDKTRSEFDWIRNRGPTASYATGPTVDHTFGIMEGTYLYLETSYPRTEGEKARFVLPKLGNPGQKCLLFYYHMYGEDMGSVKVILRRSVEDEDVIWEKKGDQGDLWRAAKVEFTVADEEYEIIFEGVCGLGTKGDAAIDDVAVLEAECPNI